MGEGSVRARDDGRVGPGRRPADRARGSLGSGDARRDARHRESRGR